MPIAVFFVFFAGSIVVALLYPHLRVLAILISVLCAAFLGFLYIDQRDRVRGYATDIPTDTLTLSGIQIEEQTRFTRITGRVRNGAEGFRLRAFTLVATLYDCPAENSETTDCAVIAQDQGIARVDIPPGQTRGFQAIIGLANPLEPQGIARWDYTILSIQASQPPG